MALLAIPQGLAYAVIADVPIYYGVTCGAVAAVVAALFSGSRHTILGPTNATAFMLFSFFAVFPDPEYKVAILPLLVFFVGILLIVGAYLRVADLIQYISRSVVVGYISGAAVLIMANQMRQVAEIEYHLPPDERPRTFFGIARYLSTHLNDAAPAPIILSGLTVAIYFVLRKWLKGWPVFAISLIISTVVYMTARGTGMEVQVATFEAFSLADLKPAIPRFSVDGIFEDIYFLFSLAFSIAFLAALENSVMSKTLASHTGDRPDGNQDMLSIGISNIATSFFSVLPSSGSLTRSQLNFSSGAETRFAGVFAGLMTGLGAVLLAWSGIIKYVPKCALAALVICIAISLINLKNIRICLRATRSDGLVLASTFIATLLVPLHVAIFFGVALSIMAYLRKASRPELVEYDINEEGEVDESQAGRRSNPLISLVHVEGELFFGAAELFRSQIQRTCSDPNLRVIILRMRNARRLDATSVMALEELIHFLRSAQRHLIVSGATDDVYRVFSRSGVIDTIGKDNIFMHDSSNPNLATRDALKRAQQLLGTKEAEVRIYYDPNQPKAD